MQVMFDITAHHQPNDAQPVAKQWHTSQIAPHSFIAQYGAAW